MYLAFWSRASALLAALTCLGLTAAPARAGLMYEYSFQFGSKGKGDGQFRFPRGVALGTFSSGN